MPDAHTWTERRRKNRRLAVGLLMVSFGILGLMFAVVFGIQSGFFARLIEHVIGARG